MYEKKVKERENLQLSKREGAGEAAHVGLKLCFGGGPIVLLFLCASVCRFPGVGGLPPGEENIP